MEGSSDRQIWLVRFLLCKLETHECQYKADGCGSGRPRRVDRAGRMGDRKYQGAQRAGGSLSWLGGNFQGVLQIYQNINLYTSAGSCKSYYSKSWVDSLWSLCASLIPQTLSGILSQVHFSAWAIWKAPPLFPYSILKWSFMLGHIWENWCPLGGGIEENLWTSLPSDRWCWGAHLTGCKMPETCWDWEVSRSESWLCYFQVWPAQIP